MISKLKGGNVAKLKLAGFKADFKKMMKLLRDPKVEGGDSAETAIPVYLEKEHEYACGKIGPLIVLGANNSWKVVAKKTFKEDKKNMLHGSCYLADGTLNFISDKGAVKIAELKKAAKEVLNKEGLKIAYCKGQKPAEEGEATEDQAAQEAPSSTEGDAATDAAKAKREKSYQKMEEGLTKMEGASDKLSKTNIEKYEAALAQLKTEANSDGSVDPKEAKDIARFTKRINKLKNKEAKLEGKGKKMTPARQAKIQANISKIDEQLQKMLKSLGL